MSSSAQSAATGIFLAVVKSAKPKLIAAARFARQLRADHLSSQAIQTSARLAVVSVVVVALWVAWPKDFASSPTQGQILQAQTSLRVAGSLDSALAQDTSQINDVAALPLVGSIAASASSAASPAGAAAAKVDGQMDPSPARILDSEKGGNSFPARSPGNVLATPTFTPTPTSSPTVVPVEALNVESFRATPTPSPTPTNMPILRPTPEPVVVPAVKGRLWPDFVPAPADVADHYWLGRPFASGNQFASALYPYGTTASGKYLLHHGVDMGNPFGTGLVAVAPGEIVHAGPDSENILGPYPNFYGNAVVIRLDQRLGTPDGERDVFVLYGHMSEVTVAVGQRVEVGDLVGYEGMTGIALGPHLHLEVRVGNNDYISTINPWLWMKPFPGMGSLAVRVLAADGSTWQAARLSLIFFTSEGSKWVRTVTTYLDAESIGPDPAWGENGAMGDLSAGSYMIVGKINDERVEANFTINPGQTTFVELRTQQ